MVRRMTHRAPRRIVLARSSTLAAGLLLSALLHSTAPLAADPPDADQEAEVEEMTALETPSQPSSSAAPALAALAGARVVDLSWTYDDETLYWPTSPSSFELERLSFGITEAGYFYSANSICTPEHGGTHLDAPIHFAEGAWAADEIPAERFLAPAVVIDVSKQAAQDADYRLAVADVETFEATHGRIPAGSVVLLRTDWDRRWPDRLAYFGDDTPGDASKLHFPSFGVEAARILVDQRGVIGLGVDTASIDYGPSRDFPVHRVAGKANVYGLENLRALDELPPTGAWVIALPMKIGGGSGGPVRVVALVE